MAQQEGNQAKPKTMLGANGFNYKQKYGVIVICIDEADQQGVFAELKQANAGTQRKIKVVTV